MENPGIEDGMSAPAELLAGTDNSPQSTTMTNVALEVTAATDVLRLPSANSTSLRDLAEKASKTVDFADGHGDLTIIVLLEEDDKNEEGEGGEGNDPEEVGEEEEEEEVEALQAFRVSSHAMIRACLPWQRMLTGPFAEAQAGVIDFTADDAEALTILMNIIHLRFAQVPKTLEIQELARLAKLTDKYMATTLVQPWIENWLRPLRTKPRPNAPASIDYNWISWEYGLRSTFNAICTRLFRVSAIRRQGEVPGKQIYSRTD